MNSIRHRKVVPKIKFSIVTASAILFLAGFGRAAVIISEVDPSGSSSNSNTYNADWFELTNTDASVQDITGWKIDDNSHTFANAVALRGVTSIGPGKSVVFVEGLADGSTDATIDANFTNFWFGGTVPAGFSCESPGRWRIGYLSIDLVPHQQRRGGMRGFIEMSVHE